MKTYAYHVRHKNGWGTGCGPRPEQCHTCGGALPAPAADSCTAGYGCGKSEPVSARQYLIETREAISAAPVLKAGESLERSPAVCFACCAAEDRARMIETGRATLYLTILPGSSEVGMVNRKAFHGWNYADGKVTNRAGSLSFACRVKRGAHNMAGRRYDVWFTFNGQPWHGTQYGDNTQIAHCRRVKE